MCYEWEETVIDVLRNQMDFLNSALLKNQNEILSAKYLKTIWACVLSYGPWQIWPF